MRISIAARKPRGGGLLSARWMALGALLVSGAAHALPPTPASGTLSESAPLLTFGGTTVAGFNPLGLSGQNPCRTGMIECDRFALTIDLPADYASTHPDTKLKLTLSWEYASDDYDLYLSTTAGTEAGRSSTSAATEVIEIAPTAGSFNVDVVPVFAYSNSYTARVELVQPGSTGGGGTGGGPGTPASGPAYDEVPSVPGAPRTVVADIDSGINPYHDAYYHGGAIYGDSYPHAVTREVLAALGVKPENVVKLTRTGNIEADIAADKAFWDRVQPHELYHFVGTNIIATSYAGEGLAPLVPDVAKSAHGVGTASSVFFANPETVMLFVETEGDLGNQAAHDLAFLHPEVDIVTTSYGVSIPSTGIPLPETRAFFDSYKGVVEMGKLHFSSGGNGPGLTPFRAGAGPWWSIGVGGIEEGSSEGDTLISGVFPDFVSDFTQDIPYCMDCESEIDEGVGGTSFSTPRSAGLASRVLLKARRLVGHQGGVQVVDGVPLMVNGKGYHISNWLLRRALEQAAWIPGITEYDPLQGVFDLGGLPINPLAPWLQIGWGDLTVVDSKQVVDKALGHLELGLTLNDKDVGFCDFQTAIIQERKAYWDEIAPWLPAALGGEQTGTTPATDPFVYCASTTGMPASNDTGGAPVDSDGDGIVDGLDNCPNVSNAGQADANDNGVGDACETNPNRAPVAALSGPATAVAESSVSFDGSASTDADGDALSYAFDFGDGTTATGTSAIASHVYAAAGRYTVTLSVSDGKGASASAQQAIEVSAKPADPEEPTDPTDPVLIDAKLSADKTTGEIPLTVTFDAGATTGCTDGCRYTFVYGDGAQSTTQAEATHRYTYTAAGTFRPYVIVSDGSGQSAVSAKLEIVAKTSVVVTPGGETVAQLVLENARGPAPLTVTFDGSRSIAAQGRTITRYRFDFGDGSVVLTTAQSKVTHVYTQPGTYEPTLTVTDNEGATAKATAKAEAIASSSPGDGSGAGGGKGGGAFGLLSLLPLMLGAAIRRRRTA